MLTDKDIQKLADVFATRKEAGELLKQIFVIQKDLNEFREETRKSFSGLLTAVDNLANQTDKYHQEMKMLAHKVDRHEKWIIQIAEKLGVKLEY